MRRLQPRAAKTIALAARGAIASNNLLRQLINRPLSFKNMGLLIIRQRITEIKLNGKGLEAGFSESHNRRAGDFFKKMKNF